jgi:hypothetical protein
MHPLILQQLATDRVNDMIATAAGSRRAREGRRTRRARTPLSPLFRRPADVPMKMRLAGTRSSR